MLPPNSLCFIPIVAYSDQLYLLGFLLGTLIQCLSFLAQNCFVCWFNFLQARMIFFSIPITSLIILRKKENFFIIRLTYNCYKNKKNAGPRLTLDSRAFRKMASLDWNFKSVAIWLPPYFRHQAPSLVIPGYVCEKYIHFFSFKKKVYIDAPCKIESPVAYFLFSQQPLGGGWPRFSIPHTSFADYSILGSFISSIKILSLFWFCFDFEEI